MPDKNLQIQDELLIANPRWLTVPGLTHAVTTRTALPEAGKRDFFATVRHARATGVLPPAITIGAEQIHGDHIHIIAEPIDPAHQPRGYRTDPALRACEFPATDALLTDISGLLLVIQTADCLPLFLIDRNVRMAGLAHCGWRGLFAGLAGALARAMIARGSRPADLEAWIGPCVRTANYEVGTELIEQFRRAWPGAEVSPDVRRLDLAAVARGQLESVGVPGSQVQDSAECTVANPERYHSYRREGEAAGRLLSYIGFDLQA